MDTLQLHRDIGRLESKVITLERDVAEMATKIDKMHDIITSAGGGWRAIVLSATAGASVAAFLLNVKKIMGFVS